MRPATRLGCFTHQTQLAAACLSICPDTLHHCPIETSWASFVQHSSHLHPAIPHLSGATRVWMVAAALRPPNCRAHALADKGHRHHHPSTWLVLAPGYSSQRALQHPSALPWPPLLTSGLGIHMIHPHRPRWPECPQTDRVHSKGTSRTTCATTRCPCGAP